MLKLNQWINKHCDNILRDGIKLNIKQVKFAIKIGIKFPYKIRIYYTDNIPLPISSKLLNNLNLKHRGLCLGYGIYIKNEFKDDLNLLLHELVHTMQYEKAGDSLTFIKNYYLEYIKYGYKDMPLESEARRISNQLSNLKKKRIDSEY